jgi:DNA-directed RNA polymerase specialized sigma24 family protein
MAVEALENLRRLAAHHLPEMAGDHQRALLLFAEGKSYSEIAAAEQVSEGTVKQRLSVASAEVAMCIHSGQLTPGMRGVWVMAHIGCCLADECQRLARGSA